MPQKDVSYWSNLANIILGNKIKNFLLKTARILQVYMIGRYRYLKYFYILPMFSPQKTATKFNLENMLTNQNSIDRIDSVK